MRVRFRLAILLTSLAVITSVSASEPSPWKGQGLDQPKLELVMQLVVTCSSPEPMGKSAASKDGRRDRFWPIIGGRVYGKDFGGKVIAGGADFPVTRPDGVTVIDALYRMQMDDGTVIIIHNKGLAYRGENPEDWKYRLAPEFIAPEGKFDWLNKGVFVSTLVAPVPAEMRQAKGPNENDRVIEVYRVL